MASRLTAKEVLGSVASVPNWELSNDRIVRSFHFKNFGEALTFVNRVGELAEAMDHHPDIDIRWNKVRLGLSTHSAGGLTSLDFDLAGQINAL